MVSLQATPNKAIKYSLSTHTIDHKTFSFKFTNSNRAHAVADYLSIFLGAWNSLPVSTFRSSFNSRKYFGF